jgi:hypothetical protein
MQAEKLKLFQSSSSQVPRLSCIKSADEPVLALRCVESELLKLLWQVEQYHPVHLMTSKP